MEFLSKSTDESIRPFALASAGNRMIVGSRYEFDLKGFLDLQIEIIGKSEELANLLIKEIGSGLFIHKLDRFILHIFEEIDDVRVESHKGLKHESIANELADILIYIGAISAINRDNMKSFGLHNVINPTIEFNAHSGVEIHTYADLDAALLSIMSHMIGIRRLFPQRKWTSVSTDMTEIEAKRVIFMINSRIEMAMVEAIQLLLSVFGEDVEAVNRAINDKSSFVRGVRII